MTKPDDKNAVCREIKANMAPTVGEVDFNGKKFLSAPAVMLLPDVLNGVLVTEDVAAKFPETWNGVPVTLGHPMKNNQHVDANQPDVLEEFKIGQLFGCKWEDGKLKGFAYLDPDILGKKNQTLLDKIKANEMVEVSTGFFSDDDPTPGQWNGKDYTVVAKTIYPNHFAILPNGIGACSIAKGAGIPRVNQEQEKTGIMDDIKSLFKSLAQKMNFRVNELSHGNVRSRISAALADESKGLDTWAYVQEVFDKYFIYEVSEAGKTVKLFKRGYAVDQKDVLTLLDDKEEVVLKTEYVPAPKTNQEQPTQDQGVKPMETTANPAVPATETPAPTTTPKVMSEQEIKVMIEKGIKDGIEAEKKAVLIAKIKANEKNKLPDSALNAMSSDELLVACKDLIPADFGGLPPPNPKTNEDDGVIPDAPPCFLAPVK